MQCCGVKTNGIRCSVMVLNRTRCGVHIKTLERFGPHQVRRNELKFIHTKNLSDIKKAQDDRFLVNPNTDDIAYKADLRNEHIRYRTVCLELERVINQDILDNNGMDADAEVRERRYQRLLAAHQARNRRILERQEAMRQRNAQILNINRIQHPVVNYHDQDNQLANLANDRQNVHTEVVVNKVKESVANILQIYVPPEYETDTLKTTGEIILECKLSKQAAWQMMAKYCQDDDIYELGHGIYAKVLNSVWQYIKTSPDAEDLKKILASEMKDNIGMCAQGNLSRLCNILSGYMDGVQVDDKTIPEQIGDRFAPLLGIEDIDERRLQAETILRELRVPFENWMNWLNPLIDVE